MRNHAGLISLILACTLCFPLQPAHAAISCNISSPGWFSVYDPTVATPNDNTSRVTISCTRLLADPSTQAYTLAEDNGMNPGAKGVNQATLTKVIKYNEFQDAAFSVAWQPTSPFSGTINFGAGTTATVVIPYYARITAHQNVPAGNYTDLVTMTLTYGVATALATHSVLISTLNQCQISSPPGNITFNYTSFQATAAAASTSFDVRCTSALPYTMSLDTTSATLLGLTYTLSVPTGTYIGTGVPQIYSISGSIAAGQAGTCATATCTGTDTHTLTISY